MKSLSRIMFVSLVAVVLATGGLPPGKTRAIPLAGDAPHPRSALVSAGLGATLRYIDQEGNQAYAVKDGWDLDQYLYQSSNPLDFSIDVLTTIDPLDAAGHPAPGSWLYGQTVSLTLRAFDVDEDGAPGLQPERDLLSVNGQLVDDYLHGANEQWSINTFVFPAALLVGRSASNPTGRNSFQITIDSLDTSDVWAVEIDWAELRLGINPLDRAPVALLHGLTSINADGSNSMGQVRTYFVQRQPLLGDRIANPTMTREAGVDADLLIAGPVIDDLLVQAGAQKVNLVGHSLGGLIARKYAAEHPGTVNAVIMLGTPNGGDEAADAICAAFGLPLFWGMEAKFIAMLLGQPSNCDPGTAMHDIETSYIRNVFNPAVPDDPGTFYLTLAGEWPDSPLGPFVAALPSPNDGFVAAVDAEWLSRSDPAHRGLHWVHSHYPVSHMGLIDPNGQPIKDTLCALYPAVPGCGSVANQPVSGHAQAAADSPNEPILMTSVTVGAGGQVTVPLEFEGTSLASVVVVSRSPSVSVSMGSATFVSSTFLGLPSLAATLTSPADQSLTLRNPGSTEQTVDLVVSISTARHLLVSADSHFVGQGSALTIDVGLSSPVGNEVPNAAIVDGTGNRTSVPLTSVGSGLWTGAIESPPPGVDRIIAWTGQNGLRIASDTVSVSSGGATLDGTFDEQLAGTDDGLADALVLSPWITVTVAGQYRIAGDLLDDSGTRIVSASGSAMLPIGTQTLEMAFDGATIYKAGQSGPYRLANVTLARDSGSLAIEDQVADMGLTSDYDVRTFQHFPVLFDRTAFSDQAVDTDGDGSYDVLNVRGSVTVDTAGDYALNGRLVAPDGTQVAKFSATPTFSEGANTFELAFDGQQIAASLRDGPYTVKDLSAYPVATADVVGYLISAYTTGPYTVGQFSNTGSLKLTKTLDSGGSNFDPSTKFTIGYDCGGGISGTVQLAGGSSTTINGIPTGSICTVSEPSTPANPAGYSWSKLITGSPTAPIATDTTESSTVANTLTRDTGSLKLTKTLDSGGSNFDPSTKFTIGYDCGGGISGTVQLAGGTSATINGIPTGSICTVSEPATPANPAGYSWSKLITGSPTAPIANGATESSTVANTLTRDTGSPFCEIGAVQQVLDPSSTGQYPGNGGPDVVVRVNHGQSVQAAVDAAALTGGDINGDGYLIVGVSADDNGKLGGNSTQAVVVSKTYTKPFALIGCSVTLRDPNRHDGKPTIKIASTARSTPITIPEGAAATSNIFLMDLHGADSEVAGIQVEGNGRYLRNEVGSASLVGVKITGDYNTMHNGAASGNIGTGVSVTGGSNLLTDTDAMSNGANGFDVKGNGNKLLKLDAGEKNTPNGGDGAHVSGNGNLVSEVDAYANHGDGIDVAGNTNVLTKNVAGDKNKGNGLSGIRVAGYGNSLTENRASANGGDGFTISGGSNSGANALKSDQSNTGTENSGPEYRLTNYVRNNGGNKADGVVIPSTTKCPAFPGASATVNFVVTVLCE